MELTPSLQGIRRMTTIIEELTPDATRAGITEERLQAIVESKLRLAGLELLSFEEMLERGLSGTPNIYINVHVLTSSEVVSAYDVEVQVEVLSVPSPVNPRSSAKALLWRQAMLGISGGTDIRRAVEDAVSARMDALASEYLAANPR
jgi:hypothetical protein